MNLKLGLILLCTALAGCMPANVKELHSVGKKDTIVVHRNWQAVYRDLNNKAVECFTMHNMMGGSTGQVHAQLYQDLQLGEIIATLQSGPFSTKAAPYLSITVTPEGQGTQVNTVIASAMDTGVAAKVQLWANGSDADCR